MGHVEPHRLAGAAITRADWCRGAGPPYSPIVVLAQFRAGKNDAARLPPRGGRRHWRLGRGLARSAAAAAQQPIDLIVALPAPPTLTFSSPFLAEDAGLYKKEGLNVSHRMLVGVREARSTR